MTLLLASPPRLLVGSCTPGMRRTRLEGARPEGRSFVFTPSIPPAFVSSRCSCADLADRRLDGGLVLGVDLDSVGRLVLAIRILSRRRAAAGERHQCQQADDDQQEGGTHGEGSELVAARGQQWTLGNVASKEGRTERRVFRSKKESGPYGTAKRVKVATSE